LNAITAVICTKDRGEEILRAAESVLASTHPNFHLLIIDQSRDEVSERALEKLRGDARLTYVRSQSVGLSRSRNEALRRAETELVAFTDDDCSVPPDWLATMQQVLEEYPRGALVFCNVDAGPHDGSLGFVPQYRCTGTAEYSTYTRETRGMGAGLAVRRERVLDVGGFDEELGAGARFSSCEDRDLVMRVMLAGHTVLTTNRTFVVHYGFRTWKQGQALTRRDYVGIGAAYAKPVRIGHWSFLPRAGEELFTDFVLSPMSDVLRFRRPRGLSRPLYYLRGFVGGLITPLDRTHLVYIARS
jgi:GT2 family glycosyltransferase